MTDLTIFFIGLLVSLVVASAVGLLLWGAANEPRGTLLPRSWTGDEPVPDPADDRSSDREVDVDEAKPWQRVG